MKARVKIGWIEEPVEEEVAEEGRGRGEERSLITAVARNFGPDPITSPQRA